MGQKDQKKRAKKSGGKKVETKTQSESDRPMNKEEIMEFKSNLLKPQDAAEELLRRENNIEAYIQELLITGNFVHFNPNRKAGEQEGVFTYHDQLLQLSRVNLEKLKAKRAAFMKEYSVLLEQCWNDHIKSLKKDDNDDEGGAGAGGGTGGAGGIAA